MPVFSLPRDVDNQNNYIIFPPFFALTFFMLFSRFKMNKYEVILTRQITTKHFFIHFINYAGDLRSRNRSFLLVFTHKVDNHVDKWDRFMHLNNEYMQSN